MRAVRDWCGQWHRHYLGCTFVHHSKLQRSSYSSATNKSSPSQICLTGIGILIRIWHEEKVVLLSSNSKSGEKNVSTGDTARETGMWMAQTEDKYTWHLRLQLLFNKIKNEANHSGRWVPSLYPYSSDSVAITPLGEVPGHWHHCNLKVSTPPDGPGWGITNSPALTIGSCNVLEGVMDSWNVLWSTTLYHSCETPGPIPATWAFSLELRICNLWNFYVS